MHGVELYLRRAQRLQPPRVVPGLLKLLRRPNLESTRVSRLIAADPVLTAKVLRICNSARFGAVTPIENIHEAVTRVGFQEIYRMVVAASGARLLGSAHGGYGMCEGELWRHSFVCATAAQIIARKSGHDENVAFTAALLHDIGKVILAPALEEAGAKLGKETEAPATLLEMERKLLGVGHDETGGRLLERWDFPPNIVSAVWFHHLPKGARSEKGIASCVALGNMAACLMGHSYGHLAMAVRGPREAFGILRLAPDAMPGIIAATCQQLQTADAQSAMAAA